MAKTATRKKKKNLTQETPIRFPNSRREFLAALQRPDDFFKISGAAQWMIDKTLGILDWVGGCGHLYDSMCAVCKKEWKERWAKKR